MDSADLTCIEKGLAAGQETHKTSDAPPFTPPITAATGADILDGAKNHNDDAKAAPACGNGKTRITQGERNTRLTQLAGAMRRHGMDAEAIYAGLAVHNATHCEPPLSETELRTIAQSVCSYAPKEETKSPIDLIVIRGDEAVEKPLRFTWKPYLPQGKLVHFGGKSSQAKSPVTIDLAARFSTGAAWPDGTVNVHGPRSVILLNIEDGLEDTILPRFRVAGGDKSKLYYVKGTRVAVNNSDFFERMLTLDGDMQHLTTLASSLRDLALIIIDPITNYLGSKKYIDESDMRSILTPLANLADELGIVVITVGHLNRRDKGTDPMDRFMGASAFLGVARAAYAFGPDPEENSKFSHVMTVVRGCGGEGSALRYHTELVTESGDGAEPNEIVKVVWDGSSNATAEDAVDPSTSREKSQEEEAAEVLKELLRNGRKPATVCRKLLKEEGHDLEKLNAGRVREKAGADSKKFPGDKFYSWYLRVAA